MGQKERHKMKFIIRAQNDENCCEECMKKEYSVIDQSEIEQKGPPFHKEPDERGNCRCYLEETITNWGEFKDYVERQGLKDSSELGYIDWDGHGLPYVEKFKAGDGSDCINIH